MDFGGSDSLDAVPACVPVAWPLVIGSIGVGYRAWVEDPQIGRLHDRARKWARGRLVRRPLEVHFGVRGRGSQYEFKTFYVVAYSMNTLAAGNPKTF